MFRSILLIIIDIICLSLRRVAVHGHDRAFDYSRLLSSATPTQSTVSGSGVFSDLSDRKLHAWNDCRAHLGMGTSPDDRGPYLTPDARQQYMPMHRRQ